MPHPLERRLASVRRYVRALVALHGLGRVAGALVGLTFALALADYLVRFQDPGVRLLASLCALATLFGTAYRYLYLPAVRAPSDVDVARRIECSVPRLGNRFSSAIEFLRQAEDDPESGSAAMRRAVIAQSTEEVGLLDPADVIDVRPAVRTLAGVGAVCVLAALVAMLDLPSARIALARLANPLGQVAWPRKNHLLLLKAPTRIASGQSFEVEVVDRNGPLPAQVRIHYRYQSDGQTDEYSTPMQLDDGVMVARKANIRRPFQYRAEGGDDNTMPWTRVEVVQPPRVESLQLTLHPPGYTGWAPVRSEPRIHALCGTRVQMRGTATRPLRRVTLEMQGGHEIAARITGGGRHFAVDADDWVIEQSGAYRLVLEDTDRITSGSEHRWEIRAEADRPPRVSIERPEAEIFVTPGATVPVRVTVQDNLAVRDVALVGTRTDPGDGQEVVVPIYAGPPEAARNESKPSGPWKAEHRVLEHAWDLRPLDLVPGNQIELHARASDYQPQLGTSSPPRRVRIVTVDQFEQRIAQRQHQLLEDLERALKLETEIYSATSALQQRLGQVDAIGQQQIDRLQAAELNQRKVSQILTGSTHGVGRQTECLLADMAGSQIDRPQRKLGLQRLHAEVRRLRTDHLPAIRRELTAAWKTAQAYRQNPPVETALSGVDQCLSEAGRHQQGVIDVLEGLVHDLSQGLGYHYYRREVCQLRHAQLEIQRSTQQLGRETLTCQLEELTGPQRANLEEMAKSQVQLARRLDQLEQDMHKTCTQQRQRDRHAAAALADAVHTVRQLAISSQMRATGDNIGRNQVGQAATRQGGIARDLAKVLQRLHDNAVRDSQASIDTCRPGPGSQKLGGDQPCRAGQQPGPGRTGRPNPNAAAGRPQAGQPSVRADSQNPPGPGLRPVQQLLGDVWGHLPARARERLIQWSDEQFVPEYEVQIERYFKRLAEQPPSDSP